MKSITQDMKYLQSLMGYAQRKGVSAVSRKYNRDRSFIYFWRKRWDGSIESLRPQSKRPHHHPNQHTEEELTLIRNMRRRNPDLGLIELWRRLRERGYTRCVESLYRVLKREGMMPQKNKAKVYFYDTGLVCYLTRWSSPEVAESGAMSGALLENFAVSEIMKSYQNAGLEPYLYFYRDRDAKEIDVILEGDGKVYPLEIKKTAMPDKRLTRVFGIIDKSPLKLGTGAVLCTVEQFSAFDSNNLIVPIWMI